MRIFKILGTTSAAFFLSIQSLVAMEKEYVKDYAIATTDTGFKQLMSNKTVAKDILNCFVPDFKKNNVTDIEKAAIAIPPLKQGIKKQTFMDYHVTTQKGDHVIVEMQAKRHIMFDERALYYACYTYSHQISDQTFQEDTWFTKIKKVYAIQFLDFDTNKAKGIEGEVQDTLIQRIQKNKMHNNDYIKHYVFTDKYSKQKIESLQMIQIELPRVNFDLPTPNSVSTKQYTNLEWWLALLKNSSKFTKNFIENNTNTPEVIKTGFFQLDYSVWDPNIQAEYNNELNILQKYRAAVIDREIIARIDERLTICMFLFAKEKGKNIFSKYPTITFGKYSLTKDYVIDSWRKNSLNNFLDNKYLNPFIKLLQNQKFLPKGYKNKEGKN